MQRRRIIWAKTPQRQPAPAAVTKKSEPPKKSEPTKKDEPPAMRGKSTTEIGMLREDIQKVSADIQRLSGQLSLALFRH